MIQYTTGTITNGLNSVPGFSSTTNYLTWFYQMPGDFVGGISQVVGIQEHGISILITVFAVAMIMTVLMHFTTTNHN